MYRRFNDGIIEVIAGPMFAGKSDELIKRINILGYANTDTLVFKPKKDTRFNDDKISSRSGYNFNAISIESSNDVWKHWNESYKAVAIDEAQFFDMNIVNVVQELADKGIRVMISGLDKDYKREPFGPMPQLMAIAESVLKLTAVCFACKNAAGTTSYRKNKNDKVIQIGDKEYAALCRKCYTDKIIKNK